MSLTITREQRDAIYAVLMNNLVAIGDVWEVVERRDYAEAKRLGRLYAEELRLLEDLGWTEHIECDTVDLTLPRDALVGTMSRLQTGAAGSLGTYPALRMTRSSHTATCSRRKR
jgi:hypothetical protein